MLVTAAFSSDGRPHRPLVIGHRGASGYRPEHTLASYELAARLGADYLELDLVPSRDGFLVCCHEPEIGGTTNVADHPEFADRKRTVQLDGTAVTGWFTHDFTLAELKTLRARERLPELRQHNTMWDGRFEIPTLQEVIDLRARLSHELGREIGLYLETKHPTYLRALGLPLEARLIEVLHRARLDIATSPVHVQSFEVSALERLRRLGLTVPLVQLVALTGAPYDSVATGTGPTFADLVTPAGLASVARYATAIGPDKALVIPRAADGTLGRPTALVAAAHGAGLRVHPYTFRAENAFLPRDYQLGSPARPADYGRALDEQFAYLHAGIDGVFTDQPDISLQASELFTHSP